ncbi:hypothetical protein L227DRAFT_578239 [Lentinus tigrinus ALCF2SS1-6]|uniref:Yeast cell wall synthesis Kre9/Knh1-like N-terminal domain-containing protein n=1 Tax=Lentinus tigrinus ALCF2SS1-6 TaxID=1328759 RepID=A0A5C2S2H7_9APHY|nr:hypothetical protein L227DRAFT_578239 [Lentinus tigrinus ALCF2SS1-6]
MSPALNALRLLITIAAARAFYMPPAFNAEAVPGYNTTTAAQNSSSATGAPEMSTAVFDFRNRTAWYADTIQSAEARSTSTPAEKPKAAHAHDGNESEGATSVGPRDVWAPTVTAPDAETVWTIGSTVTVRWDASHPPNRVTNYEGKLLLGHFEDGDNTNEHLDIEHPLAEGFNLTQGHVKVKVPDVKPSNHYIVVLFGDSGNWSPQFTIAE